MTPTAMAGGGFRVLLDGVIGPVAASHRRIACCLGARIAVLDSRSDLSPLVFVSLPVGTEVIRLAIAGEELIALLRDGRVMSCVAASSACWSYLAFEGVLDLAIQGPWIIILQRGQLIAESASSKERGRREVWGVPRSIQSLRASGGYVAAFGPSAVWIARIEAGGLRPVFADTSALRFPVAFAARQDEVIIADHLAGLIRLGRDTDGLRVLGVVESVLHPRAVVYDGDTWLAAAELGLVCSGSELPLLGPDPVLDLLEDDGTVVVIQQRRITVLCARVTASWESPGFAFQAASRKDVLACSTERGLFLFSTEAGDLRQTCEPLYFSAPPRALAFASQFLLAATPDGLDIVDTALSNQPRIVGHLKGRGEPVTLTADSETGRAFWGCGRAVRMVDVSTTGRAAAIGEVVLGVYPRALANGGATLYASTGPGGIYRSDIGAEIQLEQMSECTYAIDVSADRDRAAVAEVSAVSVYAHRSPKPILRVNDLDNYCACVLAANRLLVASGNRLCWMRIDDSRAILEGITTMPYAARRLTFFGAQAIASGIGGVVLSGEPDRRARCA